MNMLPTYPRSMSYLCETVDIKLNLIKKGKQILINCIFFAENLMLFTVWK